MGEAEKFKQLALKLAGRITQLIVDNEMLQLRIQELENAVSESKAHSESNGKIARVSGQQEFSRADL